MEQRHQSALRRIKRIAAVIRVHKTSCAIPDTSLAGLQLSVKGSDGYMFTAPCADSYLSADQREFFEKNGYLLVRNNIERFYLDRWKSHFKKMCDGEIPFAPGTQVNEL